jgi:hypothetical protein
MEPGFLVFVVVAIVITAAYAAFQQWIRQQRRVMVHRERLAAIEKGIDLPPLEQEIQSRSRGVQRALLFGGLIWLSIGLGTYLTLSALVDQSFNVQWGMDRMGNPVWIDVKIREGMQWIGVALLGIGASHLVVYAVGRNRAD